MHMLTLIYCTSCEHRITFNICIYSIQQQVEEKEYAGYQLMGNAFNVEATGSNVIQLILKKLDGRYRDLHEKMIDAIAIGSLKNWPSENNEGTKNNFTDGILVTFF